MTEVMWPQAQAVDRNLIPEDALECWSVTSILAALHRHGLQIWMQQNVARTAFRRRDTLATMNEQEAVKFATNQNNWQQDYELSDAACGSEVHRALEAYVLDGVAPDVHAEAEPFVASFNAWLRDMQPRPHFEAVEMTVFDPRYLYAGTLDAIVRLGDQRYVLDYKTTRNDRTPTGNVRQPYPEWSLQLAAYRYAPMACAFRPYVLEAETPRSPRRYYISPDDLARAQAMPVVDGALILQLTREGWRLYPVRAEQDAHNAFLYVRGAQQFIEVTARKSVFGAYLEGRN